ncbi:interleukin-17D [Lampris incognitus]|uniref:interleukin-17D n=1 Tax=Lampris incognitus TaxID=2546036 RepID=UPI0024B6187D|nr:interleukin-17D [Lampris incognitus]
MTGRICVLFLHLMLLSDAARVKKKAPRSRPCLDLPEEILEQMFGRLSVGVLNAFHHTLQLAPLERRNLTCPSAAARPPPDAKSRIPVNSLSLSPWAYRITHDPARYPRYIPEAYCLCKGCLMGPHGEESDQYRSTPIYTPSVILKRTGSCVGGRHSYTETYVSIPVGCTCVPLLEKDRDGQRSNQSTERVQLKTKELSSAGKNV